MVTPISSGSAPAPVARSNRTGRRERTRSADTAPPPTRTDQIQVQVNRFDPKMLSLKSAVFQVTSQLEQDFPLLDEDLNGRLSLLEIAYRPRQADRSPQEHYRDRMLSTKLQLHGHELDLNHNGIELHEARQALFRLTSLSASVGVLGRVPLHEPEMVALDILRLPETASFSLTVGRVQRHTFDAVLLKRQGPAERQSHQTEVQEQIVEFKEARVTIVSPKPAEDKPLVESEGVSHQCEGQCCACNLTPTETVMEAVGKLPPALRQYLSRIEMNPHPYRFEIEPGKPIHADMTADKEGLITMYPRSRDVEATYRTLLHELGHTQSFQLWGYDEKSEGWQEWFKAMDADTVAPSRYARENASAKGYEDFAEATTAYFLSVGTDQYEEVRRMFPHRFAILERINQPTTRP